MFRIVILYHAFEFNIQDGQLGNNPMVALFLLVAPRIQLLIFSGAVSTQTPIVNGLNA
jgi:hypothetical protein